MVEQVQTQVKGHEHPLVIQLSLLFQTDQFEAAFSVLAPWKDQRRLRPRDRRKMLFLVSSYNLVCVPIWGAAAILDINMTMCKRYIKLGIINPIDTPLGPVFGTDATRYAKALLHRARSEEKLSLRAFGQKMGRPQGLSSRVLSELDEILNSLESQYTFLAATPPKYADDPPPDDSHASRTITEMEARKRARAEAEFWYHSLPLFGLSKAGESEVEWALKEHGERIYQVLRKRYQIVEG